MILELRDFDKTILALSFQWLNDPEIKFLTNTRDITREGQIQWYNSLPLRTDYLIKSIFVDGQPVGAMGLKDINLAGRTAEYFGYIGNRNHWGKGIGVWMLKQAEAIAVEKEVEKIYLKVIVDNCRAINLYFKAGFKIMQFSGGAYLMVKYLNKS